jgi:KaiC/GvpD/RAD55 family RecA-like ATPase
VPAAVHEVTDDLSDDDIAARLAALEGAAPVRPQATAPEYRHYRPLVDAADEYVTFARTPGRRIYLGIESFDAAMRGIAPGELCLVVGYAHSGKTVLTTEVILNNADRRIAFFTPDETRVLVLVKLASLIHGISAEELEARIAADDGMAVGMVRSVAEQHLPHLAVFDQGMDLHAMDRAVAEVTHAWGAPPELLIFDYLDLLQGAGDDVPSKVNAIKAWGKRHNAPLILLHQSSRTAGADGKGVTISSGGFGGEQQATFMLGVRRRKNELLARIMDLRERIATSTKDTAYLEDKLDEAEYELTIHQHTVTFNLVKNKRPPSRLVEEVDMELDQATGRIRPFNRRAAFRAANARTVANPSHGAWSEPTLGEDF